MTTRRVAHLSLTHLALSNLAIAHLSLPHLSITQLPIARISLALLSITLLAVAHVVGLGWVLLLVRILTVLLGGGRCRAVVITQQSLLLRLLARLILTFVPPLERGRVIPTPAGHRVWLTLALQVLLLLLLLLRWWLRRGLWVVVVVELLLLMVIWVLRTG